jgi:hypothetical protein
MVVGSLEDQVTRELTSRTLVVWELFRKKLFKTASLSDLPLGIG